MLNNAIAVFAAPVPPVTNSYESIATYAVGAGGVSSITFSSIPSTFKHLQVRALHRTSGSDATGAFQFWLNNDTAGNYSGHQLFGDGGGSASASGSANTSYLLASSSYNTLGALATASSFAVSIIDILDYANTNKYKTIRALTGRDSNEASTSRVMFESGAWRSTSAVNRLDLRTLSGTGSAANFVQYSHIALYGIKG